MSPTNFVPSLWAMGFPVSMEHVVHVDGVEFRIFKQIRGSSFERSMRKKLNERFLNESAKIYENTSFHSLELVS